MPHIFTLDKKFLWAPWRLWQCGKMAYHPCHQTVKSIFNTEDVGNKCQGRWGEIYNALGGKQQCTDRSCHHHWQGFQFPFLVNSCIHWYNYPKLQDKYKNLILATTYSAEIDNTFNHNWPAVTHGTEPDKILHTEADLCYFTGLFIPTINLANSKPKHIFLVTRLERLFLKSTIG